VITIERSIFKVEYIFDGNNLESRLHTNDLISRWISIKVNEAYLQRQKPGERDWARTHLQAHSCALGCVIKYSRSFDQMLFFSDRQQISPRAQSTGHLFLKIARARRKPNFAKFGQKESAVWCLWICSRGLALFESANKYTRIPSRLIMPPMV
jgi:hypothetical protein